MALLKKGTCQSDIIVSSMTYVCGNCGYVEIIKDSTNEGKKCPKCDTMMEIISAQTTIED